MLWAMFCRESVGPGIREDVNLTTYLNVVADQARLFTATVFPDGRWPLQSSRCCPGLQIPQISIPIEHLRNVLEQQV